MFQNLHQFITDISLLEVVYGKNRFVQRKFQKLFVLIPKAENHKFGLGIFQVKLCKVLCYFILPIQKKSQQKVLRGMYFPVANRTKSWNVIIHTVLEDFFYKIVKSVSLVFEFYLFQPSLKIAYLLIPRNFVLFRVRAFRIFSFSCVAFLFVVFVVGPNTV